MKLKFFAYIRDKDYAGCKEMEWPVCEDMHELGEQLSERFGAKFRKYYFSPDGTDFGDETIILINGRRVEFLDGMQTKLKDTDTVLLFPMVAGG